MRSLILLALCIRLLVIFMLLVSTDQLCGQPIIIKRLLRGVLIGLLYALACMRQDLYFLGNKLWYFVFTILIALAAFGMEKRSVRPVIVFFLINLILDGIASDRTDIVSGLVSVVGLLALYLMGFLSHGEILIPVQLSHNGKVLQIYALRDTGNRLVDPVTGKPILIVGADIATELVGLTEKQLRHPVEAMGSLPGMRLIPYSTIGQQGQLILAMKVQEVRIGKRKRNGLVAFAPVNIGTVDTYQALMGGNL